MAPSKIDVFGRELFVTSLDRTRVVTLDKFVGLQNSTHHTNLSTVMRTGALHAGDLVVIHSAKLYKPRGKVAVRNPYYCIQN